IYVIGDLTGTTIIDGTNTLLSGDLGALLVAAFDPAGNTLFAKSFGDGTLEGSAVGRGQLALAPGGGIGVSADLWGTVDLGGGPIQGGENGALQGFLLALSPKGDFAWSRSVRSEGGGEIAAMTASDCFLQVTGSAKGQVTVGDVPIGAPDPGEGFV